MEGPPLLYYLWQVLDREKTGVVAKERALATLCLALSEPLTDEERAAALEGVPEEVGRDNVEKLSSWLSANKGLPVEVQLSASETELWKELQPQLIPDDYPHANLRQFIGNVMNCLRSDGVVLNGTAMEAVLQTISEPLPPPQSTLGPPPTILSFDTAVPSTDPFIAAVSELAQFAPPDAIVNALFAAKDRMGRKKFRMERIVEEGDEQLDAVFDDLELAGGAEQFEHSGKKPMRPFSDKDLEELEKSTGCEDMPRRTWRVVPFTSATEHTDEVMCEAMRLWYNKTLDEDAEVYRAPPTVLDELVQNLVFPRKGLNEGPDVGDPSGVLAEMAFALQAKHGPSYPGMSPMAMLLVHICSMDGIALDRMMRFTDVPDGEGVEEYVAKHMGRRNPHILAEITVATRGMVESCRGGGPQGLIVLSVSGESLAGVAGINDAELAIEFSSPDLPPKRTAAVPVSSAPLWSDPIFAPVPCRIAIIGMPSERCIGSTELVERTQVQRLQLVPRPDEADDKALAEAIAVPLGSILLTSVEPNEVDPNLLGRLGQVDDQKQWSRDRMLKWIKVMGALMCIARPLEFDLFRTLAVTFDTASQHKALTPEQAYCWHAPTACTKGESVADQMGNVNGAPRLKFHISKGAAPLRGVDTTRGLGWYPSEQLVILSPFSNFKVVANSPAGEGAALTLSSEKHALGDGRIAALRQFEHACVLDLQRADEQLVRAMDRVWEERGRELMQLVTDGNMRLQLRAEEVVSMVAAMDSKSEPIPLILIDRLEDRIRPPPPGTPPPRSPHGFSPVAPCISRPAMRSLLPELVCLWYDKEGDVLDELAENLSLPPDVDPYSIIASVAASLFRNHSARLPGRGYCDILALTLLALESTDIDHLCLLPSTPPAMASAHIRNQYLQQVPAKDRNIPIFETICSSLNIMCEYQLGASVASKLGAARRKALLEPYEAARSVVSKWIKLIGLILGLPTKPPNPLELRRTGTPLAGEVDRWRAISTPGSWCMFCPPSRCGRASDTGEQQEDAEEHRKVVQTVEITMKGVPEVIDLSPLRDFHAPGDPSPPYLIPPLSTFLVDTVDEEHGVLKVGLLCRGLLGTQHPAIRSWAAACAEEGRRADVRIANILKSVEEATERHIHQQNVISLGKRVVLHEWEVVRTVLQSDKNYRFLVRDRTLPSHCGRNSIGTVGNVTDPVILEVRDMQRHLRELSAEMRGDSHISSTTQSSSTVSSRLTCKVVSVHFDDKSVYVLPEDVLMVHPVTWLPPMPKEAVVVVRWAELSVLQEDTFAKVKVEVNGTDVSFTTGPPRREGQGVGGEHLTAMGVDVPALNPLPEGGPLTPIWEEAFNIDLVPPKLAEAPLSITFTVFAEKMDKEEYEDEYDRMLKETTAVGVAKTYGTVTLTVTPYMLLDTRDSPREWKMVLLPVDLGLSATTGQSLIDVAISIPKDEIAEEAATANQQDMLTPMKPAVPLGWRKGEFASDRICTACDQGDDNCTEATYVCRECDEKLCKWCWNKRHPAGSTHKQLLLYYHCDFCYEDLDAGVREVDLNTTGVPALWHCKSCDLNLCKQCWHDEH
eukprot:Sspe_Gene.35374::Locus_17148_Transcript_2_2_Confidence_0.667_Length_4784::g.35374::m.35374